MWYFSHTWRCRISWHRLTLHFLSLLVCRCRSLQWSQKGFSSFRSPLLHRGPHSRDVVPMRYINSVTLTRTRACWRSKKLLRQIASLSMSRPVRCSSQQWVSSTRETQNLLFPTGSEAHANCYQHDAEMLEFQELMLLQSLLWAVTQLCRSWKIWHRLAKRWPHNNAQLRLIWWSGTLSYST